MTTTHGIPPHRGHPIMTCNCPACLTHKNADTLIIAQHGRATPCNKIITRATYVFDVAIDAETGKQHTYYRHLPQRYVVFQGKPDRQRILNDSTTVFS